jgi:hypothetical protein
MHYFTVLSEPTPPPQVHRQSLGPRTSSFCLLNENKKQKTKQSGKHFSPFGRFVECPPFLDVYNSHLSTESFLVLKWVFGSQPKHSVFISPTIFFFFFFFLLSNHKVMILFYFSYASSSTNLVIFWGKISQIFESITTTINFKSQVINFQFCDVAEVVIVHKYI